MRSIPLVTCLFLGAALAMYAAQDTTPDDRLKEADAAFKKGETDKGLKLVGKVIADNPKHVPAYLYRAAMYKALHKYKEAIADYDEAVKLDPKAAIVYHYRGMEHFKLGHMKQSIADFDKFIELVPEKERAKASAGHWQRGISYYYTGQFKEGKAQFEALQTLEDNDVENAVWRYMCMVPLVGKKEARQDYLKIKDDKRVPMMEVYALFAGKAKPQDVLDAAKAGKPKADELNERLFYAHLYLGLYYQTEGDNKKALEHLTIAATKHPIGHYMWDVARVNRDLLLQKSKNQ